MMENFVSSYELDMYGYLSQTNVKYVVLKNESKTSVMGEKPKDVEIRNLFISL
jgi:hypothetical protein